MPRKHSQKTAQSSVAVALSQDDMILMETKFALFIQQVKEEAQQRMDELESRMENSLAMVDKYYHIELMKTPPQMLKMQLRDLMNGLSVDEFFDRVETGCSFSNPSDVSIAVKSEADSSFATPPLTSSSLRRVKSVVSRQKAEAPTTTKASKGGKLRALVNSQSTGSLRTKTRSCVAKQSDQTQPHLRSRSVSAAGDLQLTMRSSQGKKICLTEENVEDMDLSELDAGAVEQIHKMKRVMDLLAWKINLQK